MSINSVHIVGNLTREPELRMAGQTPVLQLGIAVNDRKKNNATGEWEDVPNFFDVVVWGTRGESLSRFLQKGSKVAIKGRLHWNQWQNADGEKRSKVEIVAEDVELMNSRNNDGGSGYAAPAPVPPSAEILSEDIPF